MEKCMSSEGHVNRGCGLLEGTPPLKGHGIGPANCVKAQ